MFDSATPYEALQAALARAGSQSALARICGVGQPAVWKWLQASKRLPPQHVLKVEAVTGISRFDLRPDIYPRDIGPRTDPDDCSEISFNQREVACDRPPVSQRNRVA
ncbi:YdaS family helix-turn-helix protein [uncultured Sphingomonas sp.]|uniref:transcriptional regulator n=1 Tax=uncultured Sphingomonas sp. TaxID=158754 RepID=UPI0025D0BCE3|nr:YdaS family helix-turn-helix protein [uncultured Sphingomonas sp.]